MGVEGDDEGFLLPLLGHDLPREPLDQCLLTGKGGLVNAEKRADGRTMGLDSASFPVIGNDVLWDHSQLLSQMHDNERRDVLFLRRKASLMLKIFQQAGSAEQVVIGL